MHMTTVSDPPPPASLVPQARQGVSEAIASLYAIYAAGLLRLGIRLTGSRADAEDLLHDLFVGLPELLSSYEEHGKLDAWLRGVMARMAIARIRRDARRARALHDGQAPQFETARDVAAELDIERAVAALPDALRIVFVLRYVEDHDYDEIAQLLDISAGAARVRYLRALHRLRAFLEKSRC
jgi:RNA polymerase sigma-70 factor, ECF subfamily